MKSQATRVLLCGAIVCLTTLTVSAKTIFVNNVGGSDRFDGTAPTRDSGRVGPVRTLHCAVRLANFGDTIVIANEGQPYYESLTLTGRRHSGNETVPFRIIGNGATLSGLWSVPIENWRQHDDDVWSFEPIHKGHYLLLRDGRQLERVDVGSSFEQPVGLPKGKFTVYRGRVFYKPGRGEDIRNHSFDLAQRTTGVSLYGVRNVVIRDLNVEHFRVDGLNAHSLCRDVLVSNLTSTRNGRSGLTVAGSSSIVFRRCTVRENLVNSLRIMERGQADVQDSELDVEPSLIREFSSVGLSYR